MRAAAFIILTSRKAHTIKAGEIDRAIAFAQAQKLNPIVVLGNDGDDIIGSVEKLEEAEMVFDPNDQGNEFSGIKAGLHATGACSFVWRADSTLPSSAEISELQRALLDRPEQTNLSDEFSTSTEKGHEIPSADQIDVFSSVRDGLWLVTLRGVTTLRSLPAQEAWLNSGNVKFATWKASNPTASPILTL